MTPTPTKDRKNIGRPARVYIILYLWGPTYTPLNDYKHRKRIGSEASLGHEATAAGLLRVKDEYSGTENLIKKGVAVLSVGRIKSIVTIGFICLLIMGVLGCKEAPEIDSEEKLIIEEPAIEEEEITLPEEKDVAPTAEEQEEVNEEMPAGSDPVTLYSIDYENGTIPIGDLPIGARVVDPTWVWEHKMGRNYSDDSMGRPSDGSPLPQAEVKSVTWIVVARDHYDGLAPHVTLLSEELIALYTFDNSTGRGHKYDGYGYNHWGDSGTANATHGLRPWLNSIGIHAGGGFFYQAFSLKFMMAVLNTPLPNREWKEGKAYTTHDRVFIPSTTELGDKIHSNTYQIGTAYPYFADAGNAKRIASLDGVPRGYWTRSPGSDLGNSVCGVYYTGEFHHIKIASNDPTKPVRPALNLKSEILVSEIRN
jgi:hypothetical protein